jgi:hypothetical protein
MFSSLRPSMTMPRLAMERSPDNLSSRDRTQAEAQDAPSIAGIRPGPALAGVLYLLLVASAALALWVRGYPGQAPVPVERAAPWAFLAFLALFAFYRFGLVRAGRYPAFKALFQVGAGVLFFTLLSPSARWRDPVPPVELAKEDLAVLLSDGNVQVRRLAAEVARHRPDGDRYRRELVRALTDDDPSVRGEAHRSLVAITGQDLGPPEDAEAVRKWKDQLR